MGTWGRFFAVLLLLGTPRFTAHAEKAPVPPSPSDLAGLTTEATLNLANEWGMKADDTKVTIWTSSHALNFQFMDGTTSAVPMPHDRMVVSIAPYIMKTHSCSGRYPSICRGELADTPVHVTAVSSNGTILFDEDMMVLPNGFVDLWLPRDLRVDGSLRARGLKAVLQVGTFENDNTCVTTAKLGY
jgi:hypothetical protein